MTDLICLPGLMCTPAAFAPMLAQLDRPAHVLDLPVSSDWDAICHDLADAIPAGAVLCGMSMGSYVCLDLARCIPDRIRGIVLIGTRAEPDSPEAREGRAKAVAWAQRKGAEALADSLSDSMLAAENRADPALRATMREMCREIGLDTFALHQAALAVRPGSTGSLPQIEIPVLVLTGDQDTTTPPDAGRAVAAGVPHGRFEEIAGAAHMALIERPAVIAARIAAFLADLSESNALEMRDAAQ